MATGFIQLGHTVIGVGRSEKQIDMLSKSHSSPNQFSTLDVTDFEHVLSWAKQTLESVGPPDLLINNAASINRNADLWNVPPDEFSNVFDVNLKGVHHVITAFVPAMIQARQGVIVNFSSGWGRATSPQVAPYCATKWGIEGLTQAMAQELPVGLSAVALNPGIINTDMLQSCFGPSASAHPTADQWAKQAVPFLLNLSESDNGQSLTVS